LVCACSITTAPGLKFVGQLQHTFLSFVTDKMPGNAPRPRCLLPQLGWSSPNRGGHQDSAITLIRRHRWRRQRDNQGHVIDAEAEPEAAPTVVLCWANGTTV
jgi:hypothetical protein